MWQVQGQRARGGHGDTPRTCAERGRGPGSGPNPTPAASWVSTAPVFCKTRTLESQLLTQVRGAGQHVPGQHSENGERSPTDRPPQERAQQDSRCTGRGGGGQQHKAAPQAQTGPQGPLPEDGDCGAPSSAPCPGASPRSYLGHCIPLWVPRSQRRAQLEGSGDSQKQDSRWPERPHGLHTRPPPALPQPNVPPWCQSSAATGPRQAGPGLTMARQYQAHRTGSQDPGRGLEGQASGAAVAQAVSLQQPPLPHCPSASAAAHFPAGLEQGHPVQKGHQLTGTQGRPSTMLNCPRSLSQVTAELTAVEIRRKHSRHR